MPNSKTFGFALLGAISFVVFWFGLNDAVVFSVMGLLLMVFAVVTWQRTRLPLMTTAAAAGVLLCCAEVGMRIYGVPTSAQLPLVIGFAIAVCLLIEIEKRWHPEQAKACKEAFERATLTDMLQLKHIPKLTNRATAGDD